MIFVEPWFLNRHLALEVNLFHRDLRYLSDFYSQRETGATFGLTRALFTDAFRVGVSYTIENIGIHFDPGATATNYVLSQGPLNWPTQGAIPPQVSPTLAQEEGDRLVTKVGLRLSYDTRSGGFLPNRGQLTSFGVSVAGGPLGGETDFYKLELESSWYFRGFWPGHVLEVGGRGFGRDGMP